jgi:enterochelin esterase-like enzyme
MKKIFLIIAIATCVLFNNQTYAQERPGALTGRQLAAMFPPGVKSPEYNADGTVTFRFQAPNAHKVDLNCQMFEENKAMTKDEKGVWSITVTPPAPDIYPYCFVVDGIQVTDPNNVSIFPNEGFKNSLADVRGPVPDFQDMQDVPHGKISYRYYHSKNVGFDRPLCVYTPAGYDPKSKEDYPVLYLVHGMTDTYETWFKVGRINMILDNLIAQGLAKKMIVVMPYANPYPEMMRRGLATRMDMMGTDLFTKEILNEVIPFIEQNYQVRSEAGSRAIAGFSLGGRQILACGLGNPDKFNYVCAFAPAIFGNEVSTNFDDGTYAKPDVIRSSLKLMWLSCGTSDFLYQTSLALHNSLNELGIEHKTMFPEGGHTWMNCRDFITEVAKFLFK